jgi:DNA invertase Pin-like site-specific DNA recombinase
LVEETSRLARNQASILNFVRTMGHYGIRVCFVSQCLNSSDENFALILSAFSMTDQMYVDRLRVKVLSGQKERVLRGFHAGIVPYGYRMVPVHNTADPTAVGRAAALGCKLEVVEEQAAIVRRIFQQFVDGNGVVAIGRQLNAEKIPPPGSVRAGRRNAEWSRGTVRRILRNSTFRGEILWNTSGRCRHPLTGAVKQLIKPEHEHVRIAAEHLRIVDDEIWFKAAEKLRLLEHKAQVV